jgi:hypothetical protein
MEKRGEHDAYLRIRIVRSGIPTSLMVALRDRQENEILSRLLLNHY